MTKKNWFLLLIPVTLAVVYIIYFTDWFRPQGIQIYHTLRPLRALPPRRQANPRAQATVGAALPVIFGFKHDLKLTLVKVLAVAEMETNKYPVPIWNLVSDSNSAPVKALFYGTPPPGMRLANKGQVPQPLVPGVVYRLYVEAGDQKGHHDFTTKPAQP